MNGCTVRQAVLAELDELVPLFDRYRQFYGRDSDRAAVRDFLRKRFEHGESIVFVARNEQGEPLGFTQLYPSFSSVSLGRIFVLNDLFVVPSARRCGVGQQLLEAAARFAGEVGAIRLTLSTATTNHTAQALYRRLGWQRDEQFWVYNLPLSA